MTSKNTSPRLRRIDESNRKDHSQLEDNDDCFFLLEYTARAGFNHGRTNNLISNIKKSVDRRSKAEYQYKILSMRDLALELRKAVTPAKRPGEVWVPVPPSKARDDPLYDDRMLEILNIYSGGSGIDIREIVVQDQSMEPSRVLGALRPGQEELLKNYRVDERLCSPEPSTIVVVDDVLTSGAHYKAMKTVLLRRFPESNIVGLFLARTIQLSL